MVGEVIILPVGKDGPVENRIAVEVPRVGEFSPRAGRYSEWAISRSCMKEA